MSILEDVFRLSDPLFRMLSRAFPAGARLFKSRASLATSHDLVRVANHALSLAYEPPVFTDLRYAEERELQQRHVEFCDLVKDGWSSLLNESDVHVTIKLLAEHDGSERMFTVGRSHSGLRGRDSHSGSGTWGEYAISESTAATSLIGEDRIPPSLCFVGRDLLDHKAKGEYRNSRPDFELYYKSFVAFPIYHLAQTNLSKALPTGMLTFDSAKIDAFHPLPDWIGLPHREFHRRLLVCGAYYHGVLLSRLVSLAFGPVLEPMAPTDQFTRSPVS